MKKKLAVGILSAVLLAGGATAAFGATESAKLDEIKSLTQQMFGIQKQIIDKQVEAGLRTAEQADTMKKFIDQRQQASEQALAEGEILGPCLGGKGIGMGGGKVRIFNNGEPMTEDQIEAWSEAQQARLEVQKEAMKNGTFVPGGMGGIRKGMRSVGS